MSDQIDNKLLDKRVVQRYLKKNRVDEKDYERHLKSLPDLAESAVPMEAALDSEAIDELEDEDDDADEEPVQEG